MTSERTRKRAIVLIVDRLGSGYLGPYGNTWLETPVLNELARHSQLLEQAITSSTELTDLYLSLWSGLHPAFTGPDASPAWLPDQLAEHGCTTRLLTDDRLLSTLPASDRFQSAQLVLPREELKLADEPELTGTAQLLAAATEAFEADDWDLLWIHSRGMDGPWDAPAEFRMQYKDEEDPDPPLEIRPPQGPLPAEPDPDWLQGWIWAYAGQVELFDWCLRPLFERWRESTRPTLWILLGARGYPLGEHGHLGDSAVRLHSELVHVPFLIVSSEWRDTQARYQTLVQPSHLHATLLDWFELPRPEGVWAGSLLPWWQEDSDTIAETDSRAWPRFAVVRHNQQWAIRTDAWHACLFPVENSEAKSTTGRDRTSDRNREVDRPAALDSSEVLNLSSWGCELYLKPDDRWDFNDVSDRCASIVMAFQDFRERLSSVGSASEAGMLELDPALRVGLE